MDDFLQKLKKVVCIVLYGAAISQSDCRKAGPYQLPCNNVYLHLHHPSLVKVDDSTRKYMYSL